MKPDNLFNWLIAFCCVLIAVSVGWTMYLSVRPPLPQQPYQSVQTIRIEYVQVQQPEAK